MSRARGADVIVVWTLSIILAAVFLFTGFSKLFGAGPISIAAASMHEFPQWMRIVVGIVEVAGAIGLLVPATASFTAVALAVLMLPAAATEYAGDTGHIYVPIIVLILLLIVAWLRNASQIRAGYRSYLSHPHPMLRDGVIAGLIGACVIAVWFLIVDVIAGHPLRTPETLGRGLIAVFGPTLQSDSTGKFVLVYTVFHFAAFIVVGLIASVVVYLAKAEPSILLGFVVLFVATEIGFYGFTSLLHEASPLMSLAWYQVMVGNLLAAAAMGYYFWRTHRELPGEFRRSLDWDADVAAPDREHSRA